MTYLAQPRQFTLPEFEAYVQTLSWNKGWRPSFLTGHNTAAPRLSQYLAYSPAVRRAWPGNLNRYYRGMGWHSGPHLVICPPVDGGGIWLLCDLEQDGVSVSCWNARTIGIENVGDYETEDPTTGHGAEVRDLFVGAAAALCKKLGWTPRPQVLGVKGVHWHHQCTRDHHPCPGKNWNGDHVLDRIEAAMGIAKVPTPTTSVPQASIRDVFWLQASLNSLGCDRLDVDGILGPHTRAVLYVWQTKNHVPATGQLDAPTIAAIEEALSEKAAG